MINRPRGTNDFLPQDTAKWQYLEAVLRLLCREFGYEELRTPIFEHTELFTRGVGETTDIVQKEMYTFEDMGGRNITLRPENTASAVRAYLENKMYAGLQPVKVYYIGPMFRYERPQAGRFRQFHQFGVEVFGTKDPSADAEVITLAWEFYNRLGLTNLEVRLNSVGCPNCRPSHREKMQEFLRPHLEELCPTCRERFNKNPLRILDCKSPVCQEITAGAPTIVESLCPECAEHYELVKDYLQAAGIPYVEDAHLVRGLDYYTKTAFEIVLEGIGAQSAVCGGGRYDGLVEEIGGEPTPGVGFALGLERVFSALKQCGLELTINNHMEVFVAAVGREADLSAFVITTALRHMGVSAFKDDMGRSLKAQMKYAAKYNVDYTVIVGDDELAEGNVILRNMVTSEQDKVAVAGLLGHLRQLLQEQKVNKPAGAPEE